MNQQTHRRMPGIGAFRSDLERIRIWIHNNQRGWFTASDVGIHSRTLKAMTKRNLIKTAGRVGNRQIYEIRSGGWVFP